VPQEFIILSTSPWNCNYTTLWNTQVLFQVQQFTTCNTSRCSLCEWQNIFWLGICMFLCATLYKNRLSSRQWLLLLSAIKSIADEVYIFQQNNVYWLIVHVKQWNCSVVTLPNSLLLTCGRPTALNLIRLITVFGEWHRNESTTRHREHDRAATEVNEHVAGFQLSVLDNTIQQWRKTRCLCSRTRKSVRVVALT